MRRKPRRQSGGCGRGSGRSVPALSVMARRVSVRFRIRGHAEQRLPPHRHGRAYPHSYEDKAQPERSLAEASLFRRHGPACPGHLCRHAAAIGGPGKPGHPVSAVLGNTGPGTRKRLHSGGPSTAGVEVSARGPTRARTMCRYVVRERKTIPIAGAIRIHNHTEASSFSCVNWTLQHLLYCFIDGTSVVLQRETPNRLNEADLRLLAATTVRFRVMNLSHHVLLYYRVSRLSSRPFAYPPPDGIFAINTNPAAPGTARPSG